MTQCKIQGCVRPAVINGVCNEDYWKDRWLDNRIPGAGIILFSKMIVPDWVRNEVPEFHREMYNEYLHLYDKDKKDKYDRLLAEIGFRGASKTTRSKIILLYVCCFGLEPFVVYCSQTNTFAVQDIFEVRRQLSSNPFILQYFGKINSKKVQGMDGEWSRDAYLTTTGVYVLARGVGQQIRSALRNSRRPTLAIVNDMYSLESVKTEMSRKNNSTWFFTDMFNAVDDIEGKVFFNGTILHEDTVPVTLKSNPQWKVIEYPVMDMSDFHRALELCTHTDDAVELPSDEIIYEMQKTCKLAWPERLDLRYILRKYQESYQSRQVEGFYQEYFHITTPPGEKPFANLQYVNVTFRRVEDRNFLDIEYANGLKATTEVNMFCGIDPASSVKQRANFSVLCYIAMDKNRNIYIMGYSRGKFAMRDEYKPGIEKKFTDSVELDKNKLIRIGMVDEEIRLWHHFHFKAVKVETVQQQQSIFDELIRLTPRNNAYHQIFGEKPAQDMRKVERIADILGPYFQTKTIFLVRGMSDLEMEIKHFPRGATTDILDALAYAVSVATPAEGVSIKDLKPIHGRLVKTEEEVSWYCL